MVTHQRRSKVIAFVMTLFAGLLLPTGSASADTSCPSDTICTWLGPNFTGEKAVFNSGATETAHDLGDQRHLVRSWKNASQHHWWLTDRLEGTEFVLLQCLPPGGAQPNVDPILISPRADSLLRFDTCVI